MTSPAFQPLAVTTTPVRSVVCLCAEWCGTCRDYRPLFEQVAREQPGLRFYWLDVEDESSWMGDIDVETFPTVLILDDDRVRFYGPLLPHIGTLTRMLTALPLRTPDDATATPAELLDLINAVTQQRVEAFRC